MNNPELEKLKRLQKYMEKRLKGWNVKNSGATLGDLSGATESWSNEIKTLSNYKTLHCKSFQKAKAHFQKAWDNRDDKAKALSELNKASQALASVESEIVTPSKSSHMEKLSAKSLYGDDIGRNSYIPDEYSDLYTLKRYITGFLATKSEIDTRMVKDVKGDFITFASRYSPDSVLNQYATKAINGLDMIEKGGYNGSFVRSTFNDILSIIDNMAIVADKKLTPNGYKSFINENGKQKINGAMLRLEQVVNERTFLTPKAFAMKTAQCVNAIETGISDYYDPAISRMTKKIRQQAKNVFNLSKNATKSMDMDEINKRCDIVLDDISELQTYIGNIR